MGIDKVKNVLLILSGKGGVGKSTLSCQLSLYLQTQGYKIGVLDIDICGPSQLRMFGLQNKAVQQGDNGWIPVKYEKDNLPSISLMSIGFLLNNQDSAIIWRGPRKTAMIQQFLSDVDWNDLDFLIIDTPPGTSDEHISIVECLRKYPDSNINALLITTPQTISLNDVRRQITFCHKGNIPIIGLVENMSGYICQHCSECTPIFSSKGGHQLAEYAKIELLTTIPIETEIVECCDNGENFIEKYPNSICYQRISELAKKICEKLKV